MEADPMFVDRAGGDFTLSGGSQLIDAGVFIPGINDDYSGLGPDIGALEYTFYPPEATTGVVTDLAEVSDTSVTATVSGEVDPNGSETTYFFEYGQSVSYGSETAPVSAGAGDGRVHVAADIEGLSPGATFHWRLLAQNAGGTACGEDMTLVADIVYVVETTGDCGDPVKCHDLFADAMDDAIPGGWIKVASGTHRQRLEIDKSVRVVPGYTSDFTGMAPVAVELAK